MAMMRLPTHLWRDAVGQVLVSIHHVNHQGPGAAHAGLLQGHMKSEPHQIGLNRNNNCDSAQPPCYVCHCGNSYRNSVWIAAAQGWQHTRRTRCADGQATIQLAVQLHSWQSVTHLHGQLVYHVIGLVGQQVHHPLVWRQLLQGEQGRRLGGHGLSHGR
jgi:hypothetical protein